MTDDLPHTDALAQRVVTAFESDAGSRAASRLLTSLPSSQASALTSRLHTPPRNIPPPLFLRSLWSCSSLRPTLITSLCQIPQPHSTILTSLLDEAALLLAADARDLSTSPTTRLRAISRIATVLAAVPASCSAHPSLTLLAHCVRAASQTTASASSAVRTRLLRFLYTRLQHASTSSIPTLATILHGADLQLSSDETIQFAYLVHSLSSQIISSQRPLLLRAVLLALAHAHISAQPPLAAAALLLFAHADLADHPALLAAVDAAALDAPVALSRLRSALATRVMIASSSSCGEDDPDRRLCTSHIVLVLALLDTSLYDALRAILIGDVILTSTNIPGGSTDDPRTSALTMAARSSALSGGRAEAAVTFALSELWASRREIYEGATILLRTLSMTISGVRAVVVRELFAALAEPDIAQHVVHRLCFAFQALVEQRVGAIWWDCARELEQAVQNVALLSKRVAVRIIPALVTVGLGLPTVRDAVMVLLRKLGAARGARSHMIAVAGLLTVLRVDGVPGVVFDETLDLLHILMDVADYSVRAFLVNGLIETVRGKPALIGRVRRLSEDVLRRLRFMDTTASSRMLMEGVVGKELVAPLDFTRCFELEDGSYVIRMPVPQMIQYCAAISNKDNDAKAFFERYLAYLGDVKGALAHGCTSNASKVPVLPRMRLLCSQLQVVIALHAHELSVTVFLVYATCLVIRDHYEAKESASADDGKSHDLPFTSASSNMPERLTAREASSSADGEEEILSALQAAVPLCQSIQCLDRLDSLDCQGVLLDIVRSEILLELSFNRMQLVKDKKGEKERMMNILAISIRKALVRTCPWILRLQQPGVEESDVGANESTSSRETRNAMTESHSTSVRQGDYGQGVNHASFLSSLALPNPEAEKALLPVRVSKLKESVRISVRQSSFKLLMSILSEGAVTDVWQFLLSLAKDCLPPPSNLASVGSGNATPDTSQPAEEDISVTVVHSIARLFQMEFASSMSIDLTLSYISLFSFLVDQIGIQHPSAEVVRKEVSSAMRELLRDFSIRHTKIIRHMVNLLLKAYNTTESLEFSAKVLDWLGNNESLLSSKFSTAKDEVYGQGGFTGFDEDIIEEGIRLDIGEGVESDQEKELEVSANQTQERRRPNALTRGDDGDSRAVDNNTAAVHRSSSRVGQDVVYDPVRSLCLNETPDNAMASVTCILGHVHGAVAKELRGFRQMMKEGRVQLFEGSCLQAVMNAMTSFVDSEFVTTISPRDLCWPVLLQRRLAGVLMTLMEITDLLFKLLLFGLDNLEGKRDLKVLADLSGEALSLLFEKDKSQVIFSSAAVADQASKRWSLQEKVENSATAFILRFKSSHATVDGSIVKELKNPLTALEKQMKKLPKPKSRSQSLRSQGDDNDDVDEDNVLLRVSRPSKRQRVRSRNPVVDMFLREENDGDNYADLEDFIVPMDEENL